MHEASTEATPEVWRRPRAELEADLGSAVSRSLKLQELSSAAPPPPLVSSLAAPAPLYLNKAELFGPGQQHFPLNSFLPGRGARGAGSLGAGRDEGAGSMFASTESLTQSDLGTRPGATRKIRFNPYNEFSD